LIDWKNEVKMVSKHAEARAAELAGIAKFAEKIEKYGKLQEESEVTVMAVVERKCMVCGNNHDSRDCFAMKSRKTKWDIMAEKGVCYKCMRDVHRVAACRQRNCDSCGGAHHNSVCTGKSDERFRKGERRGEMRNRSESRGREKQNGRRDEYRGQGREGYSEGDTTGTRSEIHTTEEKINSFPDNVSYFHVVV